MTILTSSYISLSNVKTDTYINLSTGRVLTPLITEITTKKTTELLIYLSESQSNNTIKDIEVEAFTKNKNSLLNRIQKIPSKIQNISSNLFTWLQNILDLFSDMSS